MPLREADPYLDSTLELNPEVNPFVRKLIEGQREGTLPVVHGPILKNLKGSWLNHFQKITNKNYEKLYVEIGCHKGRTLLDLAERNPDCAFIGLDITFKRVVISAERAKQKQLDNVICSLANAKYLSKIFAKEEVDGIVIFFPDPWLKKRQAKNKLINPSFCDEMWEVLKSGGFFSFKTDQKPYFDQVEGFVGSRAFRKEYPTNGINPNSYASSFELRFQEKGLETYGDYWVKNPT